MPELSALLSLASTFNGYWSMYLVVIGAVLGLQSSGKPFSTRTRTKVIISAMYMGFAVSNCIVIKDTDDIRRQLRAEIEAQHASQPTLVTARHASAASFAKAGEPWYMPIALHLIVDLLVVLGIWYLPKHSSTEKTEPKNGHA